jgi:hypothetical protein
VQYILQLFQNGGLLLVSWHIEPYLLKIYFFAKIIFFLNFEQDFVLGIFSKVFIGHFLMKKKTKNKEKIALNIFKKVTS